jgi:hypothetical protein
MNKAPVQALVVLTDPILFSQRKRTVDLANKNWLPAMYFFSGICRGEVSRSNRASADVRARATEAVSDCFGYVLIGRQIDEGEGISATR